MTGADGLVGEHHRLQAGAAHLVDRQRGDVLVESAMQRRLPRGVLSLSRGNDIAHDAFVDDRGIDAGAEHRFGHHERAELRRRKVFERAEKFSGGCPDGAHDY